MPKDEGPKEEAQIAQSQLLHAALLPHKS